MLQCISYLHASTTTIAYVFRIPRQATPQKEPKFLHHVLDGVKSASYIPETGSRFDLAKGIATTLSEFHKTGWLHKNIHPENIFSWHSKDLDGAINLRKPYLVSFDLSRINRPGEISEKPMAAVEDDLCHHPAHEGPDATTFKQSYDCHSLGICCLRKQCGGSSLGQPNAVRVLSLLKTKLDCPVPTLTL